MTAGRAPWRCRLLGHRHDLATDALWGPLPADTCLRDGCDAPNPHRPTGGSGQVRTPTSLGPRVDPGPAMFLPHRCAATEQVADLSLRLDCALAAARVLRLAHGQTVMDTERSAAAQADLLAGVDQMIARAKGHRV